jgi:hypothetical protein
MLSGGQGESAHTLVLTVKTQKLEIVYFWKFDIKFGSKSIKLVYWKQILINNDPNRGRFLFIFPHPSPNGTSVWVNSPWASGDMSTTIH